MKHIEQIQPEVAAGELSGLLLADATATAALTALLHNVTGCDIPPLTTTPQSEVEELVPLCLSILRRHWTTPLTALGDGTTPMSLADLLRRLIGDRVQGNEAWSIPPANANISTAVSALRQRDMSSGLTLTLTDGTDGSTPTTTSLPDGLSLAQLLGSGLVDNITELHDSNKGWIMTKALTTLPNLEKLKLCCSKIYTAPNIYEIFYQSSLIKHADLSAIEEITCATRGGVFKFPNGTVDLSGLKVFNGFSIHDNRAFALIANGQDEVLNLPSLTSVTSTGSLVGSGMAVPIAAHCSNLKEVYMPNMTSFYTGQQAYPEGNYNSCYYFTSCPNIEKIVLGKLSSFDSANFTYYQPSSPMLNLIHLEIGEGTDISLKMAQWKPTMALRTDTDAEDYVDLREDISFKNNRELFLSNFRLYIADRLSDNGSGKTLTLSQEVRDAIQQDPEIVSIITSKGWTISPAPSV